MSLLDIAKSIKKTDSTHGKTVLTVNQLFPQELIK